MLAATVVASLTAALAIAAPAVALTTTVYDNTTADHHLVLSLSEDGENLTADITNLTTTDTTWGLAGDLTVKGSRTPLWDEGRLGDFATIDIGRGGTVHYDFLPNWSGQRLSFYAGVPGTPVLVDEYTIPGPFTPVDIHFDPLDSSLSSLQIGFVPTITPAVVRAGERPYVTVDGLPDGAYTVYLTAPDQVLNLVDFTGFWVPDPSAVVVASGVPSTGGHLAASVLIPNGLSLGEYSLTIGDPAAGWWPVGPLYALNSEGINQQSNLAIEPGAPRSTTPTGAATVEPLDQFGQTPVSFAFDNVTTAGTTTVTTSTTGPTPSGFQVAGGTYYELATTAGFAGDVRVCIAYDTTPWVEEDGLWEALRLYHYESGAWTALDDPEPAVFGTVCGITSSFSPFAVGIPDPEPVLWPFTGFLAPVQQTGVTGVNPGASVPLKFRLGGDRGLGILATAPTTRRVPCAAETVGTDVTVAAGTSANGLSYDAATGTYNYVWKTLSSWSGQCRVLTLTLTDGSVHTATFEFSAKKGK
jgi:hypothetical protein